MDTYRDLPIGGTRHEGSTPTCSKGTKYTESEANKQTVNKLHDNQHLASSWEGIFFCRIHVESKHFMSNGHQLFFRFTSLYFDFRITLHLFQLPT